MTNKTRWLALQWMVEEWAADKGILDNATQLSQAHKTLEESLELAEAIRIDDRGQIIDAFGDVLVTVIIGCRMAGIDPLDALQSAYEEISGRTGKMVGGQFVKD